MSTAGIVCEYNPFHKGHKYHVDRTRELLGEDTDIVCVISGDFVQRGEAAIMTKFARAEAACRCGADLVVELPLPWSLASAERFAAGAVSILAALGAEHLSFGAENEETESLGELARITLEPDFQAAVREKLGRNAALSYPAARQLVLEDRAGKSSELIERPNNILAVEYLKAIYSQGLRMEPLAVGRVGSGHDELGGGRLRSAADIRTMLGQDGKVFPYMPPESCAVLRRERTKGRLLTDRTLLDTAILSRLRMLKPDAFDALPDAADGAGRRLYNAVRTEGTLEAVLAAAKTKRFTMSRLKRIAMCAALGVTAELAEKLPPYARVLAANEKGCAILGRASENPSIPILSKPASVLRCADTVRDVFTLGADAHDLYTLGFRDAEERKAGRDWRTSPKIV